ncbi:hypothetical protein GYMLUDRAFT_702530 [Collybiopsis luxurians FD-317 M1]|uniref:Uncharacterized protein n=1 Tax=Collybiopsis luxurians FD-317 M1 TaxID=944289 RepID=A0A0D0BSH3_9AGAR|nr:hypothetical protein GYMLUDRAFT_702530 [Collybiopsis luxurians FD-317 M1]
MGDDHVPFLRRGIRVLHLTAELFRGWTRWRTLVGEASTLDSARMRQWNILMKVFTAEYLDPELPSTGKRVKSSIQFSLRIWDIMDCGHTWFSNGLAASQWEG